MQTTDQRVEFHAAYKAWTELRELHEAELLAIVRGENPPDQQHLVAQAAEMIRAHKRFVDATRPFIGYGNHL